MAIIRTVNGDIDPGDLGFCQAHEHVWCDYRMGARKWLDSTVRRDPHDTMLYDEPERMLAELRAFRAAGGDALVDVTTNHWRPDPATLRWLSSTSGVHIVAAGGFYVESTIPEWVDSESIRGIADRLVQETCAADGASGVAVGLFKSAITRARIERAEAKALRAVCRAILRTGLVMTTHTDGGTRLEIPGGTHGLAHLKIFAQEGVPAHRLIVGHVDERPDIGVLDALAAAGCYVQFDVIGKEHWLLDDTRALLLAEMRDRGYLDRLLLGTDRCRKAELYRERGGHGYTYLFDRFFERLRRVAHFSDQEIEVIMRENPARALAFRG